MRSFKSYFGYSKGQRYGILLLLAIILVLQAILFFGDFTQKVPISKEERDWLGLQTKLDSLNENENGNKGNYEERSYNPNFITDYKGYKLGMSVAEIDRLFVFRKKNKYVNSAHEFQQVTKISDSLLQKMAPNFKFPDWVQNKRNTEIKFSYSKEKPVPKPIIIKDINHASASDLIMIYGVGEALSQRILNYKQSIGGDFVSMEQIKEVWGLSPEVIQEINSHFQVITKPEINKIPINDASLKELSQFFYFKNGLAKQILIYRSMNGNFNNIEDLSKIKGFPVNKANIINLYLEF